VTTESFGNAITELQPATTAQQSTPNTSAVESQSDLVDSLIASLSGSGADQLATAAEARCAADGAVASIGEAALVAAGAPDDFQPQELSTVDQEKMVNELLRCIDFTSLLIESVAGAPVSAEAFSCLTTEFEESGVVRRAAAVMIAGDSADDALAGEIVTTVGTAFFKCLSAEEMAAIFSG
jgi:hypothetical protein